MTTIPLGPTFNRNNSGWVDCFACGNNVVNIILIVTVFKMGQWTKYIIYFRAGAKHDKKGPKIYLFWYRKCETGSPATMYLALVICPSLFTRARQGRVKIAQLSLLSDFFDSFFRFFLSILFFDSFFRFFSSRKFPVTPATFWVE